MRKIVFSARTKTILVFLFFGLIFASITFVNHYNFRTYAWDLGINQNAIYDYAHFRGNDCMIMQPSFSNILADHFSLYPVLISPFYWIFGSWTMLIFQFLAILFGGQGVFRYVKSLTKNDNLAIIALAHFFSIWGIYSALSFDYHDNVVAAMLVPWLLYHFKEKNKGKAFLFFVLILISKENMALWAVFIGFGLAFRSFFDRNREQMRFALTLSFIALIYFVVIIKFVIPGLAIPGRGYLHNSFSALGNNFGEVTINILKHPLKAINLLFNNHNGNPVFDGIKGETYLAIALAGGFAMILRPEFLIMIIPIIGQKMFNDVTLRWGISMHYSIEFAPIIVIALYHVIYRLKKNQLHFAFVFLLICLVSTSSFLDHRVSEYYMVENNQFYKKDHWVRDFDVAAAHRSIEKIPQNARVSAQVSLAPHLAFRDYIYAFPFIGSANYIALIPKEPNKYPLNDSTYQANIDNLLASKKWVVFEKTDAILILKKVRK